MDNDIILGKSTFREIIEKYGDSDWLYIGDMVDKPIAIAKHYEGIYFSMKLPKETSNKNILLENYLDNRVTNIDIVKIKKK